MEHREQYKRIIMFFSSAFILAAQTAIYAYVWFTYYDSDGVIRKAFFRRGNWVVVGMYLLMLFFFYKMYGGFKVGYLRVLDVLYSQIASVLCVNAISYLQLALIGRWRFGKYALPMLYMTLVDLIVVVIWVLVMRWIYVHIYPPRKMLLIYGNKDPRDLLSKFSSREDKYDVSEVIRISDDNKNLEEIKEKMDKYHGVILGDIPSHERNLFLKYCFHKNIRCYCIPKISDVIMKSSDSIHLFDTPLLLCRNRGLTFEQKFLKRLTDIIIASIGTLIASPFMLVIALLIKLYDGGPVFYRQIRLTEGGRTFNVFKFRSMGVDSEKDGARLAMKHDSRVTPVGRVLRNIHFDELPQLFNILNGDMSLVGPRPERPQIAIEYGEDMPEFDYRLKVKAGLTGYAQVYGKYNTTPYDKLKLDLTYIENYSYLLDWKLMFMTVKILFQKENTEGVEAWQVTAATKEEEKLK